MRKWLEFSIWLPWMTWEVAKVAAAAWYRLFIFGLALALAGCLLLPKSTADAVAEERDCGMTLSVRIADNDATILNLHSDCMAHDIDIVMHDEDVAHLIAVLLRSQADQTPL